MSGLQSSSGTPSRIYSPSNFTRVRDDQHISPLRSTQNRGSKKVGHALGDMNRRGKCRDEPNSSTRCGVSETQRSFEAKMIRVEVEIDFHRVKDREGIPPFEAMLSLEEKRAIYSGIEIPKDRKGVRYRDQVMMITVASPKDFPELLKEDDEGIQIEEDDETVESTQAPPAFEERGQAMQDELLEINLGSDEYVP